MTLRQHRTLVDYRIQAEVHRREQAVRDQLKGADMSKYERKADRLLVKLVESRWTWVVVAIVGVAFIVAVIT
jgi:hypothetical protein